MNRDECWMTFSEALEQYIVARSLYQSGNLSHKSEMVEAAEHMDALTTPPEKPE